MASDPRADPNLSPGQQAELAAHFARMNVNAPAFVPNVHAQPFVPVYGGPSPYGYSMTGSVNQPLSACPGDLCLWCKHLQWLRWEGPSTLWVNNRIVFLGMG